MSEQAIEIPPDRLSPEILAAVLDDFINREGTDYGEYEWTLEQKRAQLREQLAQGQAYIVFDPITESCTLLSRLS